MTREIDPLALLIKIAKEKHIDKKWKDQPLYLIKILPNSNKGNLAEEFVVEYCNSLGFKAKKEEKLGDFDIKINDKKFEVKMATEDLAGNFQFNHIRLDFKYEWLLCMGFAPAEIFFDMFSKADVATGKAGVLVPMGKGHNADFKLTKPKNQLKSIRKLKKTLQFNLK